MQEVPPRHLVDSAVARPIAEEVVPGGKEGEVEGGDGRQKEEERVKGRGNYTGHGPFSYLDPKLESSRPVVFAQP